MPGRGPSSAHEDGQPRTAAPQQLKSCFVLMPFRDDLADVYRDIKSVARGLKLKCWRADEVSRAGNVFGMILEDIKNADVIIADLTGRNPNVFYETAVAHMEKGPQQVILLAQSDGDVPFDLQALRYLKYTNSEKGRAELKPRLREFVRQAIKGSPGELLETIEGTLERTRRIVADCNVFLHSGNAVTQSLIIRTQAGLSSFAISEEEITDTTGQEREYRRLLRQERDLLRNLLSDGAILKAILSPPADKFLEVFRSFEHLGFRYRRLISAFEGQSNDAQDKVLSLERCHVVLSPFRGNNTLMFGDRLLYEGVKGSIRGGFDLTTRITHKSLVAAHVRAFDSLYDEAEQYTLASYGDKRQKNRGAAIRKALICGLKDAYSRYSENFKRLRP